MVPYDAVLYSLEDYSWDERMSCEFPTTLDR